MVHLTAEQQELLRKSKVADAYRKLFGSDPTTRSEIQILVWEDLQRAGYKREPVFVPDRQGQVCGMRAAFADGRRSIVLYIEANVAFAPELEQQQPKQ